MQFIELQDCTIIPTNSVCPICSSLLQKVLPTGQVVDFQYFLICSSCNFVGTGDVSQIPLLYTMAKAGKITFPDFNADIIQGYPPLTVNFTESCVGFTPTDWLWNFGDNITSQSTSKSIQHTYDDVGEYTVSLQVFDPAVGNKIVSKDKLIHVLQFEEPIANFTSDIISGVAPLTVHFLNQSTGSEISTYEWTFSDTTTYTYLQNPYHKFQNPGVYNVGLKVYNSRNEYHQITKPNYILVTNPPPIAQFTAAEVYGIAPIQINFVYTGGSVISSCTWEFGDGSSSTEINPSHLYDSPGVYTVTLTVINDAGYNTITKENFITIETYAGLPQSQFVYFNSDLDQLPIRVQFSDESLGSGLKEFSWDFGDGEISTERNPIHEYNNYNNYTVTLTVTDYYNATSSKSELLNFDIPSPNALFDTTSLGDGILYFNNLSTVDYASAYWQFGDNLDSTSWAPTHQYSILTNYVAQLTITNPKGVSTIHKLVTPLP